MNIISKNIGKYHYQIDIQMERLFSISFMIMQKLDDNVIIHL